MEKIAHQTTLRPWMEQDHEPSETAPGDKKITIVITNKFLKIMENNAQIIELNGQKYTADQLVDALNELKELRAWEEYNYLESETDDVINWLNENKTPEELSNILSNREERESELYEDLFCEDDVTGNGSGSYWFNSWKARHALLNNGDLYEEAREELGEPNHPESEESRDVTIRCYLLRQAITAALDQLQEERDEAEREAQRER